VKDVCEYALAQKQDDKAVGKYFELLSCYVLQSLFSAFPEGICASPFIERQVASKVFPKSATQFWSRKIEIQGVIIGESSLISMLENKIWRQSSEQTKGLEEPINDIRTGSNLKQKLPKVDRIIALLLSQNLHHLIEGYLIFPSEAMRPDAIGIVRVSNKRDLFKRYGLILSSTKRLTGEYPIFHREKLRNNTYTSNCTRIYLSQAKVKMWAEMPDLIASKTLKQWQSMIQQMTDLKNTPMKRLAKEQKESRAEAIFYLQSILPRTTKFEASAHIECLTKDNQPVFLWNEEYACTFLEPTSKRISEAVNLCKVLSKFEHLLPIAILIHPTFPQNYPEAATLSLDLQEDAFQFYLPDLIDLEPSAAALSRPQKRS
jgi:hypothetical protein